jgi:hypothetical protein
VAVTSFKAPALHSPEGLQNTTRAISQVAVLRDGIRKTVSPKSEASYLFHSPTFSLKFACINLRLKLLKNNTTSCLWRDRGQTINALFRLFRHIIKPENLGCESDICSLN